MSTALTTRCPSRSQTKKACPPSGQGQVLLPNGLHGSRAAILPRVECPYPNAPTTRRTRSFVNPKRRGDRPVGQRQCAATVGSALGLRCVGPPVLSLAQLCATTCARSEHPPIGPKQTGPGPLSTSPRGPTGSDPRSNGSIEGDRVHLPGPIGPPVRRCPKAKGRPVPAGEPLGRPPWVGDFQRGIAVGLLLRMRSGRRQDLEFRTMQNPIPPGSPPWKSGWVIPKRAA